MTGAGAGAASASGGAGRGGQRRGTTGGGDPPRLPHVIRPDEVDAWLADSVNKRVTYHRTTREAAPDIIEQGVDISRSRMGAYGQGFYTSTVAATDLDLREAEVAVAIRVRRPLHSDVDAMDRAMELLTRQVAGPRTRLTPAVAAAIRRELLQQGYDGIVIEDAGGDGINCAAYPTAIPLQILSGEVDHMVPRPGQVGDIVFEPIDVEEWVRTGRRVPAPSAPAPTG